MKTRQELLMWAIEQMALVHKGTGISTKGILNEAEKLVEAVENLDETTPDRDRVEAVKRAVR